MARFVGIEYDVPGYAGDPTDLLVERKEYTDYDMRELGAYPVTLTLHATPEASLQDQHFESYNGPQIEGEQ